MKLRELLAGFPSESLDHLDPWRLDTEVASVTSDSREARPGALYVAIRGGSQDGHAFVPAALNAGAVAAVVQKGHGHPLPGIADPSVMEAANTREALARLAAAFHGHPSRGMKVIGVTGTSGKTTTTYLLESILESAGEKVGVIGTVNFRFAGQVIPSTHTTPGPVELQALLAEMRSRGCTAVVMEVSSHALKQHRADHIAFDGMVFTNLSREHLDFHPDMEDYFRAKSRLFLELAEHALGEGKRPVASVNAEDDYGKRLIGELKARGGRVEEFRVEGLKIDVSGIHGVAAGGINIRSPLLARFNAQNILGAVALARGMGLPRDAIESGVAALKSVPGRLERVPNSRGMNVLVDYAHKPDALEKVLRTLREITGKNHRLLTVFGCGGDRDRTKRPVMGRLAVELSDEAIITSDNPRTEDPDAIIREIVAGTEGHRNFRIEPDRRKAIALAVKEAKAGDLILIAGKGHEDYQILGTRKIHFDDREVASEAINSI